MNPNGQFRRMSKIDLFRKKSICESDIQSCLNPKKVFFSLASQSPKSIKKRKTTPNDILESKIDCLFAVQVDVDKLKLSILKEEDIGYFQDDSNNLKLQIEKYIYDHETIVDDELNKNITNFINNYDNKIESLSLKELITTIKSLEKNKLKLYIESIGNSMFEGRSPIRSRDYLMEFKRKLMNITIEIEIKNGQILRNNLKNNLNKIDCMLFNEIDNILNDDDIVDYSLAKIIRNFLNFIDYKIEFLKNFINLGESLKKIIQNNEDLVEPILYKTLKKLYFDEEIILPIEYLFKIQLALMDASLKKLKKSKLRTEIEPFLTDQYHIIFRMELYEILINQDRDFQNIELQKKLKEMLKIDIKENFLGKVNIELRKNEKNYYNSEFRYEVQKFVIRSNMILFRLEIQKLLTNVNGIEYTPLHYKMIDCLVQKTMEDSAELYPELYDIVDRYKNCRDMEFKEKLLKIFDTYKFNKVKLSPNNHTRKSILKKKKTNNSENNDKIFIDLNFTELAFEDSILDSSSIEKNNVSVNTSVIEIDEFLEIDPKIFILDCNNKTKLDLKIEYQTIKKTLSKKNKFKDNDFLPSFSSLSFNTKNPAFPEWKDFVWKRISEIYPKQKISIFSDNKINFINNRCNKNFILALESIKENTVILKRIFEDQEYNEEGIYFVKFCHDGIWKYIIIDDQIPVERVNSYTFIPSFISYESNNDKKIDIWPLLLEKALAKVCQNYQCLNLSITINLLRDLTGAPCIILQTNDKNFFNIIKKYSELNFIMLALSKENEEVLIEEVYELETLEDKIKIINIRSPIIESNFLTEEILVKNEQIKEDLINKYQLTPKDNSIYFIVSDFINIFNEINVCMVHNDYYYVGRSVSHSKNAYSIRTISLKQPSHCFFEVTQIDKKMFRNSKTYEYSNVRLIIASKDENDVLKYIDSVCKDSRNANLELFLAPGNYYILTVIDWVGSVYEATLNFYGEEPILLDKIQYNSNNNIFETLMRDLTFTKGEKINIKGETVCLYFYASIKDCIIVENIVNNSNNKTAFVKRDYRPFIKNEHLQLMGKYDKNVVDITIKPNKIETIMIKIKGIYDLQVLHTFLTTKFVDDYKQLMLN